MPVVGAMGALNKLLADRETVVNHWLAHCHADPDRHSIVQYPVPGHPFSTMYVLADKQMLHRLQTDTNAGDRVAAATLSDYLSRCPTLMVKQGVRESLSADTARRIIAARN